MVNGSTTRADEPLRMPGSRKTKLERSSARLTTERLDRMLMAPPVVEDFSLEVLPGRRVALVGGSGSGKTTIGKRWPAASTSGRGSTSRTIPPWT